MGEETLRYCIDSDVLIDYLRGREEAKQFLAAEFQRAPMVISALSVAELASGEEMKDAAGKRQLLTHFLSGFQIIPLDTSLALWAGKLRRQLGRPLVDMAIAATALEYQLTLVTRNIKHFNSIESLPIHKPY